MNEPLQVKLDQKAVGTFSSTKRRRARAATASFGFTGPCPVCLFGIAGVKRKIIIFVIVQLALYLQPSRLTNSDLTSET